MKFPVLIDLDDVEWTLYVYSEDDILYQRVCDNGCSKGLFSSPARFCGRCGGSGTYVGKPRLLPAG